MTLQLETNSTSGPVRQAFAIVPSDATALSTTLRGVYIGSGGNLVLRARNSDADVTYLNLPDASYVTVDPIYVRATGTTAAGLVGEV